MDLGLRYLNRDDSLTADILGLFGHRILVRLSLQVKLTANVYSLLSAVAEEINRAVEHYLPYQQMDSAAIRNTPHDTSELTTIMVICNWQTDALEKSIDLGPDLQLAAKKDGSRSERLTLPMLLDVRTRGWEFVRRTSAYDRAVR
jgi:hypothetical protein